MAVSEQTPYIEYIANGVSTRFPLGFMCKDSKYLIVKVDDQEALPGEWHLDQQDVVFYIAPKAESIVSIKRNTPLARTTKYSLYDNSFRPQAINDDMDSVWLKMQELLLEKNLLEIKAAKDDELLKQFLMKIISTAGLQMDQLRELFDSTSYTYASLISSLQEAISTAAAAGAGANGWLASLVMDSSGLSQQDVNNMNRVNFVDLIKSIQKFKVKTFQFVSQPYPCFRVSFFNGTKHITYEIRKNTNDDWYMFHTGFYGNTQTKVTSASNMTAKTGTWTAPDGSYNTFTTIVGSTFTFIVKGTTVQTNHLRDNRGGLFRAVIDGDEENAVTYSCYSATSQNILPTVLATDLPDTNHTVVVTFLGNDPAGSYTTAARGWSVDGWPDASRPDRMTGNGGQVWSGGYTQNSMVLGYASNKEFAVQVTYNGQNNWIPEHNNIGTAFKTAEPTLVVDGKTILLSSLVTDKVYYFDSLVFKQKAVGKFPNDPTEICDIFCNFGFNASGEIRCYGSLKFKVNCIAAAGYGGMMPLVSAVTDTLMSSVQTQVVNNNSNVSYFFAKEGFRINDYCALSSKDSGICVGYRQNNPISTLLVNGRTADSYGKIAYWLRKDPYPKFYQQAFLNTPIQAGYKWKFDTSYIIGLIPDIYNILSN